METETNELTETRVMNLLIDASEKIKSARTIMDAELNIHNNPAFGIYCKMLKAEHIVDSTLKDFDNIVLV